MGVNDGAAPDGIGPVTRSQGGRPAPIFRANGLVRGVWLDAGKHEVRFRYRTPGLALGFAIAAAGLLGVAAWWVVARRRATAAP